MGFANIIEKIKSAFARKQASPVPAVRPPANSNLFEKGMFGSASTQAQPPLYSGARQPFLQPFQQTEAIRQSSPQLPNTQQYFQQSVGGQQTFPSAAAGQSPQSTVTQQPSAAQQPQQFQQPSQQPFQQSAAQQPFQQPSMQPFQQPTSQSFAGASPFQSPRQSPPSGEFQPEAIYRKAEPAQDASGAAHPIFGGEHPMVPDWSVQEQPERNDAQPLASQPLAPDEESYVQQLAPIVKSWKEHGYDRARIYLAFTEKGWDAKLVNASLDRAYGKRQ